MTILPQLRDQARVIRRIAITDGLEVAVDDTVGTYFPCQLTPSTNPPTVEGSPRAEPSYQLRYSDALYAPAGEELKAGDRIEAVDGLAYELLNDSRPLRTGSRSAGKQTQVQLVSVLYPLAGQVLAQGGAEVLADNVPVATWQATRVQQERGEYEESVGETPAEFYEALSNKNCLLAIGSVRHRVLHAELVKVGPRVTLSLRRVL